MCWYCFFFRQKTAYVIRISSWSSDVCSSDRAAIAFRRVAVSAAEEAGPFTSAAASPCVSDPPRPLVTGETLILDSARAAFSLSGGHGDIVLLELAVQPPSRLPIRAYDTATGRPVHRSEERRVGKEGGSKCRSWWSPENEKKKKKKK